MVCKARKNLSEVQNILVDGGYIGENFATQIDAIIGATVEVIKRNELHKFVVLAFSVLYVKYLRFDKSKFFNIMSYNTLK